MAAHRIACLALLIVSVVFVAACAESDASDAALPDVSLPGPAGESDEGRQKLLASLLSKAEAAVEDRRLTTPADDSALYYYELALAIDPNHEAAHRGRRQLAVEYVELAETAWKRGDEAQKQDYLALAATVGPSEPELTSARVRLSQPPPVSAAPPADRAGGGYPSIRAAKLAYRDRQIDRYEYDRIARYYVKQIRDEQRRLKQLYRDGGITKREYREKARSVEIRLKG